MKKKIKDVNVEIKTTDTNVLVGWKDVVGKENWVSINPTEKAYGNEVRVKGVSVGFTGAETSKTVCAMDIDRLTEMETALEALKRLMGDEA